jgi:hypothetical protein
MVSSGFASEKDYVDILSPAPLRQAQDSGSLEHAEFTEDNVLDTSGGEDAIDHVNPARSAVVVDCSSNRFFKENASSA